MVRNKFLHTLQSCWLCMRFPFLYPRNRITGKHWSSGKIEKYLYGTPPKFITKEFTNSDGQKIYAPVKVQDAIPGLSSKSIKFLVVHFIYKCILPIFHCIPTFTELDGMDIGWRKAFGIQFCKDIKKQLKKDKLLYSWRIIDIKEKWGYLNVYCNRYTDGILAILKKYEDLSEHTCIICGQKAKYLTPYEYWRRPYCKEHVPKQIKKEFLEEIK